MSLFRKLVLALRGKRPEGCAIFEKVAKEPVELTTEYAAHSDIDFNAFLSSLPTGFATTVIVHEPPSLVGVVATTKIPTSVLQASEHLRFLTEFYLADGSTVPLTWSTNSASVHGNMVRTVFGLPSRITGARTTFISSDA